MGGDEMRKQLCIILAFAMPLSACTGSMGSSYKSAAAVTNAQAVPRVDMASLKAEVVRAQAAIQAAQTNLSQIINPDGSFNWSALLGGVNFGDLSTCVNAQFTPGQLLFLPQDIANALTCVLSDVVTLASAAKNDMSDAMAQLNVSLAATAAGSPQAVEIQAMITEIQTLQTQYVTMIHGLATQISLATQFLATLPTLATSVCPIPVPGLTMVCGAAVGLLLAPIQNAIMNFQTSMETI